MEAIREELQISKADWENLKHNERMLLIIKNMCKKHGVSYLDFKKIIFYGSTSILDVAQIHKDLMNISPAFLSPQQQADIMKIPRQTIHERLRAYNWVQV